MGERGGAGTDVVLVDHHDSYTWNLAHLIASVTGVLPAVVQHDAVDVATVLSYGHVVLSPGPGHPSVEADFAVGRAVLAAAATPHGRPVWGVCLGMQGIVTAFGGRVERIEPAHGEVATISHDADGVFAGLPQGFDAVRYHSLAAVEVPDDLVVTARAEDGTVMGVRHRTLDVEGVQFHPESVLSQYGAEMARNFLARDFLAPRGERR
ncbi:anthranilate synthase component II [Nocardioides yefusunii]|uniref:Anthranilate synthase component II n=1 Tax=Nocardioides yefusunii TaxID=2500546 RepID=A0ABW1QXI2_9ACTN|nr:aminodeoxychorismate/anthranilate synthase component II [Nocardioides yefusunii]